MYVKYQTYKLGVVVAAAAAVEEMVVLLENISHAVVSASEFQKKIGKTLNPIKNWANMACLPIELSFHFENRV